MTDDDDLDLHAWAAPAAPKGLAETVIARMIGADEAIAVTMSKRRRSRWVVAAACAGTIAASIAVWLGARAGLHEDPDEIIVAMEPRRIALGGATVEVEPGTTIRAHRAGSELHVVQSGAATWHVPANERLVIDAGSSASIDATGASLRVETKMNMQDPLVMSGVALSAAAVALVGATVYQGRAEVSEGSHVTLIAAEKQGPGNSFGDVDDGVRWMRFDQRPDLTIEAGESPVIHARDTVGVDLHFPCVAEVWVMHLAADGSRSAHVVAASLRLEPGKYEYEGSCKYPRMTLHGTIDVVGIDQGDQLVRPRLVDLDENDGTGQVDGRVVPDTLLSIDDQPIQVDAEGHFAFELASTLNHSVVLRAESPARGVHYYVYQSATGGAATVKRRPIVPKPAPKCDEITCAVDNYAGACCAKFGSPSKKCDDEALVKAGKDALGNGDEQRALLDFSEAYGCNPKDKHTLELAFMAACNGGELDPARFFWRKLTTDEHNRYLIMCVRAGITREALDAH